MQTTQTVSLPYSLLLLPKQCDDRRVGRTQCNKATNIKSMHSTMRETGEQKTKCLFFVPTVLSDGFCWKRKGKGKKKRWWLEKENHSINSWVKFSHIGALLHFGISSPLSCSLVIAEWSNCFCTQSIDTAIFSQRPREQIAVSKISGFQVASIVFPPHIDIQMIICIAKSCYGTDPGYTASFCISNEIFWFLQQVFTGSSTRSHKQKSIPEMRPS